MVIALDGPWGSGKSHFLKLWVGAHTLENTKVDEDIGKSRVIYFDAFKHDYLDDPLIALTSVILSKIESEEGTTTKIKTSATKKLKKAGFAVAKGVAKTMVRKFAGDALEEIDEIIAGEDEEPNTSAASAEDTLSETEKGLAKASSDAFEKATEDFWQTEKNRKQEMLFFRQALESLVPTSNIQNEDGTATKQTHKMILVIDELDRCRPDYALSLLEIMKHFFDVPNIHFVLGVRLEALENSVRSRYGDRIDAYSYLQKFIKIKMRLTTSPSAEERIQYFSDLGLKNPAINNKKLGHAVSILRTMNEYKIPQLREMQNFLTLLALIPDKFTRINHNLDDQSYILYTITSCALIKTIDSNYYAELLSISSYQQSKELFTKTDDFFEKKDTQRSMILAHFFYDRGVNIVNNHSKFSNLKANLNIYNHDLTPRHIFDIVETIEIIYPPSQTYHLQLMLSSWHKGWHLMFLVNQCFLGENDGINDGEPVCAVCNWRVGYFIHFVCGVSWCFVPCYRGFVCY